MSATEYTRPGRAQMCSVCGKPGHKKTTCTAWQFEGRTVQPLWLRALSAHRPRSLGKKR
jgi:hypothetical protein